MANHHDVSNPLPTLSKLYLFYLNLTVNLKSTVHHLIRGNHTTRLASADILSVLMACQPLLYLFQLFSSFHYSSKDYYDWFIYLL